MTLTGDTNNLIRLIRHACTTFLILLLVGLSAFAASTADYRKRIETARSSIDNLIQIYLANDESTDQALRYRRSVIADTRKSIPETERIEMPGGNVETANQWLRIKLDEFENEEDSKEQRNILTEISERLSSVAAKVAELENPSVSDRSKDDDKQKLAENLRREEYQKPKAAEESLFQKWLREFLEWLRSVFPDSPISPTAASGIGSLQFGLQILIYALVIGLIGFLIYKFAPFVFQRFGSKAGREKQDRVILGERIGAEESAFDLFREAERLAAEGNLRAAIRKGYIALLCELGDRNLLRLARHKTNRDYLRDVRQDNTLHGNMTGLTRTFESNWYGVRTTEQADWDDFRTRYLQTIARSKS